MFKLTTRIPIPMKMAFAGGNGYINNIKLPGNKCPKSSGTPEEVLCRLKEVDKCIITRTDVLDHLNSMDTVRAWLMGRIR